SPSRATPSRKEMSRRFSLETELFNSAVLPSRTTIRFMGSPLLASVASIPWASAATSKYTPTVRPTVKAVAKVLDFLTIKLRRLYLIGRAITRCFAMLQRSSFPKLGRPSTPHSPGPPEWKPPAPPPELYYWEQTTPRSECID